MNDLPTKEALREKLHDKLTTRFRDQLPPLMSEALMVDLSEPYPTAGRLMDLVDLASSATNLKDFFIQAMFGPGSHRGHFDLQSPSPEAELSGPGSHRGHSESQPPGPELSGPPFHRGH